MGLVSLVDACDSGADDVALNSVKKREELRVHAGRLVDHPVEAERTRNQHSVTFKSRTFTNLSFIKKR